MKMLEDKVIAIIKEHSNVDNILIMDTIKELGIDSLGIVELILDLEDNFLINFDDSELDPSKLVTVEDIILLTKRYLECF